MKKKTFEDTVSADNTKNKDTKGIKTLQGDPKKAIVKLAIPMVVAMSVQTIYTLVDTFWVSGLGDNALAAMGFVFPFFFIQLALTNGLGVGGGAAISRRIGARDKAGADNVGVHTLVIMLLIMAIFTVLSLAFVDDIFVLSGAGKTTGLAVAYAKVLFGGSFIIFFSNVGNAIFRAEGDSKRAMLAMVMGSALNIVLDPIFIYRLDMGIAGAAWATLISFGLSCVMMLYWFFVKKDSYLSFDFGNFSFDKGIVRDIFRVGVPASVQQISMALTALIMNLIIVAVSNTDGVAVYSTGWKVATIAIAPLVGISMALVSVSGAAFGARDFEKARVAHSYSIKFGLLIETVLALATFVLAPWIASVFTQAESAAHITDDLTFFLRIICIFYPTVSFGMLSSSLFQGAGKGMNALAVTILRTIVMTPIFAGLFAFVFDMGIVGVWWGLVAGNGFGAMVAFVWAKLFLHKLLKTGPTARPGEGAFHS
ncbi:MAG: MATE family efflux transporter [Methanosarcinaceae archaeon]|nr:MATE family efflux transporter [Methanosarcinaceae archaeon]